MKHRSILGVLALVLLSWNASAQVRGGNRGRPNAAAENFGSVERTMLLRQGIRSGRGGDVVFGSVQRRAALMGTTVRMSIPVNQLYGNQRSRIHRRR